MLALLAEFICFPEWLWIGIGVTTGYLPKSVVTFAPICPDINVSIQPYSIMNILRLWFHFCLLMRIIWDQRGVIVLSYPFYVFKVPGDSVGFGNQCLNQLPFLLLNVLL